MYFSSCRFFLNVLLLLTCLFSFIRCSDTNSYHQNKRVELALIDFIEKAEKSQIINKEQSNQLNQLLKEQDIKGLYEDISNEENKVNSDNTDPDIEKPKSFILRDFYYSFNMFISVCLVMAPMPYEESVGVTIVTVGVTLISGLVGIVTGYGSGQLLVIISISLMPFAISQLIKKIPPNHPWSRSLTENNKALLTRSIIFVTAILFFLFNGPAPFLAPVLALSIFKLINDLVRVHPMPDERKSEIRVGLGIILLILGRISETILTSTNFNFWFYLFGATTYFIFNDEVQTIETKGVRTIITDILNSWPNSIIRQKDYNTLVLASIKFVSAIGLLAMSTSNVGILTAIVCLAVVNAKIYSEDRTDNEDERNFFFFCQIGIGFMIWCAPVSSHWQFICVGAIGIPLTNLSLQLIEDFSVYRIKMMQYIGVLASFGIYSYIGGYILYFISCVLLGLFLYSLSSQGMLTPTSLCGLIISCVAILSMYIEVMVIGVICIAAQYIVLNTSIGKSLSKRESNKIANAAAANTFSLECTICANEVSERPVISSCCQRLVGCKECVERWVIREYRCPTCNKNTTVDSFKELKGIN